MSAQPATESANRLGATLGAGRGGRRRLLLHHAPLAFGSCVVLVLFMGLSPFTSSGHGAGVSLGFELASVAPGSRGFVSRLARATGYVALGLLALTLLVGPANLVLRRRNPMSSYLRRDIGIWTAIVSVVHVIVGFQTGHGGSGISRVVDFFVANGRPLTSRFGLGNWTGLGALVIVVGLLALSTNSAVRELKGTRWNSLQRLNYTLFVLVAAHAVLYGALGMNSPFSLLFVVTVTAVVVGQAVGIWLWRRRHSRNASMSLVAS
jgi:sulfoxide reductase heme-binding subunit YedZ